MADRKISDLTALTTPASGDYLPIVDISESAAASKNKRITIEELMRGAPDGTAAAPSIAFESDPNTGIYSPGADQVAISTNGTGRLFVDASGRVGVGTSSPQAPLHVIGTEGLRVESAASSEGFIRFVNTSGSISIGMGGAVGNNLLIYDRTNNQTVYNYAAGVSGSHIWSVNNTERMRLDSSGRLGLGTSSPGEKLHILTSSNKDVRIANASHNTLTAGLSSAITFSRASDGTADLSALFGWNNGGVVLAAREEIVFANGGSNTYSATTERLRIDSSGRVGIGTTTPRGLLSISNNAVGTGVVDSSLHFGFSALDYYGFRIVNSNEPATQAAGLLKFQRGTVSNWIDSVVINNSGSVGIGTSAPAARLDVTGPANSLQARFGNVAGRGLEISTAIAAGTDDAATILNAKGATSGTLIVQTDSTERMRIGSGGEWYLNTTSTTLPTGNGVAWIAGELRAGNSSGSGSTVIELNRENSDGDLIRFYQASVQEGAISVSGTTVTYGGGHLARWSQLPNEEDPSQLLKGTVMSNLDEMCDWAEEDNEQLNKTKVSDVEGDPNIAGVFVSTSFSDNGPFDFFVAMTGDMVIRIAEGVAVERGDLLMSAGDGTAKPQDDDIIRNKTIAKVTSTNVSCTYEDGSYCVPCVLMAC